MSQIPEISQILSGLETGLAELRLQNQLITNQLYDILQAIGPNIKTSTPDVNNHSEPVPKESLAKDLSSEMKDVVRLIVKEELSNLDTIFREEFSKIDMTLGKFFQKVVSDNKQILDTMKQLQDSLLNISTLQQQNISLTTSIATSFPAPAPAPENSLETGNRTVAAPFDNTDNAGIRPATSNPRKAVDFSTGQTVSSESPTSEEVILKEQPSIPSRVSRPSQIPYADPDTTSDITNITNMINFFKTSDIDPKDAIDKLEALRDTILFDRKKEAPYRVTASRVLREALSDLNRERSRHTLTDGLQTQMIKLLTTLLNHIEGT